MKTIHFITFYLLTLLTCNFLQAAHKPCVTLLPQNPITATQKESLKTEQIICQTNLLCAPQFCWCSCTFQKNTPILTQAFEGSPAAKNNPANLAPKSPKIAR